MKRNISKIQVRSILIGESIFGGDDEERKDN